MSKKFNGFFTKIQESSMVFRRRRNFLEKFNGFPPEADFFNDFSIVCHRFCNAKSTKIDIYDTKTSKILGLRPALEPFHKKKIHFTTLEFLITTLELFSDFETFETLGTLFKTVELFHSNIVIDFHNLGTALNSF